MAGAVGEAPASGVPAGETAGEGEAIEARVGDAAGDDVAGVVPTGDGVVNNGEGLEAAVGRATMAVGVAATAVTVPPGTGETDEGGT